MAAKYYTDRIARFGRQGDSVLTRGRLSTRLAAAARIPLSMKRMSAAEWTLLLLLSVLWGGSFFFQKVALTALPQQPRTHGFFAI